jgi:hypothetical protein
VSLATLANPVARIQVVLVQAARAWVDPVVLAVLVQVVPIQVVLVQVVLDRADRDISLNLDRVVSQRLNPQQNVFRMTNCKSYNC